MRIDFLTGILAGVAVSAVTFAVLDRGRDVFPRAEAQSSGAAGNYIAVTGTMPGGNQDVLYLINTTSGAERVAVYEYTARHIQLGSVRNVSYDLQLDEYPPGTQKPNAKEVADMLKKKP